MNKILIPNKSYRNDNTWASMVGANWLFHLRILHPAERLTSDGSWRPVRWKEIASADIELATASWFDVSKVQLHSGPSGDGWDREPDIGPEDVSFRAPLLKCLFEENPTTIWVGQWDGWGNFSKPKQASKLEIPSMLRSYYVVALTQTLEENLTNCEKPDIEAYSQAARRPVKPLVGARLRMAVNKPHTTRSYMGRGWNLHVRFRYRSPQHYYRLQRGDRRETPPESRFGNREN